MTDKELLDAYQSACQYCEFWSDHGNWGDGKYEEAKRERAQLKREILKRMERGNV